jgi:hypothetical protein
MGTDLQSIVNNPIQQPMATVHHLLKLLALLESLLLDIFQQFWSERHISDLVVRCCNTVCHFASALSFNLFAGI